jgi:hypothetical protein
MTNPNGQGFERQTYSGPPGNFLPEFDNFSGFMAGGASYVLAYRRTDRMICILKIRELGAGFDPVFTSPT